MTIEEKGELILKKYLRLAKERFGIIPKHCYETKIVYIDIERENSHADLINNIIVINKLYDVDLEWVIFHEMEHIRTANNIYKNMQTGVRGDGLSTELNSINEALTEISVAHLLKRNNFDKFQIGYLEIIFLTRQLGALIGLTDDIQMLKFYKPNGYGELKNYSIKNLGCVNDFYYLKQTLENLHSRHLEDLHRECCKKGGVDNQPLGKYPSLITRILRRNYQRYIIKVLKTLKLNNKISNEEYLIRLSLIKKYNPYQTNNFHLYEEAEQKNNLK